MGLHDRTFNIATSRPTMETATLTRAGHIVRQFLVYLKLNPIAEMALVDIAQLPLPKSTLINAFRLLIASEARLQQRAQLQKVGLLLAQFQGLGEAKEAAQSADIANDPLASFIDSLTGEPVSNERFWLAAYGEQEELTQLFAMSARMAEADQGMRRAEVDDASLDDMRPN